MTSPEKIDLPEVLAITQFSRPTLFRYLAAGKFPRAIEGGRGRHAYWLRANVEAWMDGRRKAPGWGYAGVPGRPRADLATPEGRRRFST